MVPALACASILWLRILTPVMLKSRYIGGATYFVLRIQLGLIFARALFPPIDGPELKCVSMCEIRILIHSRNPRSDHLNGTIGHQNRHSQQKLCNILPLCRAAAARAGHDVTSYNLHDESSNPQVTPVFLCISVYTQAY